MNEDRRTASGGLQCAPLRAPIDPHLLGSATVEPSTPVEAGSWQTFVVTYTAGRYGIDDSGALRFCFRYAADHTKPQFADPAAPGYTVVAASNNAVLETRFDQKGNVRPYDQTVYVKVVNGYLKEGETITVTFGDRSGGSLGMRVQTFAEDSFEFRVLVDPVATFTFQELESHPEIAIVPGPLVRTVMVAPSLRRVGEAFAIGIKGEDRWGNPSDQCGQTLSLQSSLPIEGLPETIELAAGAKAKKIAGLTATAAGTAELTLTDEAGDVVASQRVTFTDSADLLPYWADFHGQSEETIGTNSAEAYFQFARDCAFVDIAGHQGNDFQITDAFWRDLNRLTAELNDNGSFVTLPGYEWSGNTFLGGDRNVFFTTEGRPMRRSSHALLGNDEDLGIEATTATELFASLAEDGEDAICFAHCGGRYADLRAGHDGRFETAVEVHSAWGTFEWLLHDALELGFRVGVVCNADGHKGRPGASYPGASSFGAIGGYTCMLIPELSREAVIEGLRRRHHYGTTGGPNGRPHLDVSLTVPAKRFDRDPSLGPTGSAAVERLMMGDIATTSSPGAELRVSVSASCGVEKVDLYNGLRHLETIHNYETAALASSQRYRVLMEGAAYRGRFRQVDWGGRAEFSGATIREAGAINFFNPDQPLRVEAGSVAWDLITTGNFGGLDVWLEPPGAGSISIDTKHAALDVELETLGTGEVASRDLDGPLPRRLSLYKLPEAALTPDIELTRTVDLATDADDAIYVRVTLEDGTQAWSSPIYLIPDEA